MPKASVDITSASREEIEALLLEFGLEGLSEFTKCFGGFSGSNYACTLTDGRRLLLNRLGVIFFRALMGGLERHDRGHF